MTVDKATEIDIDCCGQSAEKTVQTVENFENMQEMKLKQLPHLIDNTLAAHVSCETIAQLIVSEIAQPVTDIVQSMMVVEKPVGTTQGVMNDNLIVKLND